MSSTVEAGVGDRGEDGVERELEPRPVDLPPDGGLADAGDDRPAARAVTVIAVPAATKLGMAKPPGPGSKPTSTAMPMRRVLGRAAAQPADDPHAGVVGELDQHDGVRHLEVGQPALVVDREAVDVRRGR